ncbi:MAG: hypothetical protein QW035_01070 [Candidatus Anstonellales archaeon]
MEMQEADAFMRRLENIISKTYEEGKKEGADKRYGYWADKLKWEINRINSMHKLNKPGEVFVPFEVKLPEEAKRR